jgi:DHA1 family bicyclomycin/chloramphenicol resistance-like MFS transporter
MVRQQEVARNIVAMIDGDRRRQVVRFSARWWSKPKASGLASGGIQISRKIVLASVISATIVNILATTVYLAAIPAMARDLQTEVSFVQGTLTTYLAASAAGQLLVGPLSDAFGRRSVLLPGLFGCAALSVACALVNAVETLLVLRFFQGIAGCTCVIVTRAVVRDINDRGGTARDMAGVLLAIALIPSVSQLLGGFLTDAFSWRMPFEFMAVFSLLALVVAGIGLPETNTQMMGAASISQYVSSYGRLLRSWEFLAYAAVNAVLFATLYFFYAAMPIVLIRYFRVSPTLYGSIVMFCSFGLFLGSLFSNWRAPRDGLDRLLTIGTLGSGAAGITMFGLLSLDVTTLAAIALALFAWFIGYGISLPNAIAGAMSVHPNIAGAGAALLGFIQIAAGSLGSASALGVSDARGLVTVIGTLAVINVLLRWMVPKVDTPRQDIK